MKFVSALLPIVFLAACSTKAPPPPVVENSAMNDCALLSAIGRGHYKFTATDAPLAVKLNGEDLPWTPNCNWSAMGLNLVAATPATPVAGGQVEFHRPHYDSQGAEVRVALTKGADAANKELCRVRPAGDAWEVTGCKPDPKLTSLRDAPKPSDTTPENTRLRNPGDTTPDISSPGNIETRDPTSPRQ